MSEFAAEVARCRAAQQAWAALPVRERLRPIAALRRRLPSSAQALGEAAERELNRPAAEVLATDLLPLAEACRFLQKNAAKLLAPRRVRGFNPLWLMGQSDTVHRRPHGLVGVIGTWNYPYYLNGIQLAQALTAGNGVLWKPSEQAPECARLLHAEFLTAGIPPDLLQLLPATREAGPQLAEADIDHVIFTGSATAGRQLAARLGARLISSTLELSGCDALFVLPDADVKLAARAAWFAATVNKGQTCLAARRAFVARPLYAEFLQELTPRAAAAVPVRLQLAAQAQQAERLVADAVAGGAKVLGKSDLPHAADPPAFPPTVLIDARPEMAVCQEVSFAPLLAVVPVEATDDAVRAHEACPYKLAASVFSRDVGRARELAARLSTGSVTINDAVVPTAHPATPFGGRGASGWGTTQGPEGLLALTVPQTVSVRGGPLRPHYDLTEGLSPADADIYKALLEMAHGSFAERFRGWRTLARLGPGWLARQWK